ncbi:MAG: ATP-binding protein, partial [Desulfobacterales bacterium]
MHQILLNLCTNASHAMMNKGGVLAVRLENIELGEDFTANTPELEPGSYLKLSVSDTGHGMSPTVLKRIFEPYFTTKAKGSGTGLGMAVGHGIVKGHQGIITAHSEPGKGSRFDVYLPVIQEAALSKKAAAGPNPRGTERI